MKKAIIKGTITTELGSPEQELLTNGSVLTVSTGGFEARYVAVQSEVTKNAKRGLAVFDLNLDSPWVSTAQKAEKPAPKKVAQKPVKKTKKKTK